MTGAARPRTRTAKGTAKGSAKGTGVALVFDRLRGAILTLELEPGEVLDEARIAARYGVSRSPVREAVAKLAAVGLVEASPNRSPMVARLRLEAVASFLAAQEVVYRLTARQAAERRSADDVARLEAIQARHEALREAGDWQGMIEVNREFHLAVARVAGNAWYERWLHGLLDEGQRMLRLYMRALGHRVPPGEIKHHREIVGAIAAGDAAAADEAGRLDADVIRRQLVAMLAESGAPASLSAA